MKKEPLSNGGQEETQDAALHEAQSGTALPGELQAQRSRSRSRWISGAIFVIGVFAFFGANSYKDFYYEIRARSSGRLIDFQALAEFCGWTGGPRPGESDARRGLRSFWNMLSAILAMSAISAVAFGIVFGTIFAIFYYSGSLE